MATAVKRKPPACIYPQSNPIRRSIREELDAIAENRGKCSSFYLDTRESQSSGGENHHQGLARTHQLSDRSIYFFLVHSNLSIDVPMEITTFKGNLTQFRYDGPTDHEHIVETTPTRTVAPMKQWINLAEPHPSDIAFLPDVNNEDAGYLFVAEEYLEFQVSIYRWEPDSFLTLHGRIPQWFPLLHGGPNFIFIDKIDDYYYLGLANNNSEQVRVLRAEPSQLFPKCQKGAMNVDAFKPLEPQSTFPFPPSGGPSQVKLIKDATGEWFLLAFRSDPNDKENGTDYVDVYPICFSPFSISPRLFSTHIFFPAGDTSFASTGTHYVEKSGRLLISSSYRWSEDEGPGNSGYVSRVDECPSS